MVGLGLGEDVVGLGLGEDGLGLGEEVVALGPGEMLALRLGDKLAITLLTAPPQPVVRHTPRMAAKRKKLCV